VMDLELQGCVVCGTSRVSSASVVTLMGTRVVLCVFLCQVSQCSGSLQVGHWTCCFWRYSHTFPPLRAVHD